jgi:hypothetical protein
LIAEHDRLKIIWSGIIPACPDSRSPSHAVGSEPCRDTYARHGFIEEGGAPVYNGGSAIEDPDWLTVDAETEAAA